MSGLNITHVHRNLHTRVTFLYLGFEDAFVILGIAALTNILGRFTPCGAITGAGPEANLNTGPRACSPDSTKRERERSLRMESAASWQISAPPECGREKS